MMHPTVLMVSKPVAPPWNDSSKNLVKDLALNGQAYRYRVLTPSGYALDAPAVVSEPIYPDAGSHTPALRQNLLVLRRLVARDDTAVTHFFFAPNRKSALGARIALRIRPRATVQTICSIPRSFENPERVLFADRVVALSRHTLELLVSNGYPAASITHIPPAITVPDPPSPEARRNARQRHGLPADAVVTIYAGDYQFSRAASTVARAIPLLRADPRAFFVFACRIKQAASRDEEQRIDLALQQAGVRDRVLMVNEEPDIIGLLGACDVCVLPAESLYAKMDLPLVLLEAMALELPIVVADRPPLSELLEDDVGLQVAPEDPAALARALGRLIDDGDYRKHLGTNARRAVLTRYSIAEVSLRYERLYGELLARKAT